MVFHFRLFPGKINDKIFQKMRKTPFLVNFGPIFHTFGQSRTFLILTKYNCANFQKKKLLSGFQATLVSDRTTDGQTWFYGTLSAEAGASKIWVKQITTQEKLRKGLPSATFIKSITLPTESKCSKKYFLDFHYHLSYICEFALFIVLFF